MSEDGSDPETDGPETVEIPTDELTHIQENIGWLKGTVSQLEERIKRLEKENKRLRERTRGDYGG